MNTHTTLLRKASITNDRISPRLLFSHLYTCKNLYAHKESLGQRTVYDYEIEFFLFSEGSMWINNRLYPIQAGDVVLRRPGDTTQAIMPFDCYGIFFDLPGHNLNQYDRYFFEQRTFQDYYVNPLLDSLPVKFHPEDGDKYLSLFDRIHKEFINGEEGSELLIKSCILQILHMMYSDVKNPLQHRDEVPLRHYDRVKSVIEYIHENAASRMLLKDLAELAGFSPNHFQKVFTGIIGMSPNEYILSLRLKKAKELLARTRLSVTDIALKCGFENVPYFSYLFNKRVGMSPKSFRSKHIPSL